MILIVTVPLVIMLAISANVLSESVTGSWQLSQVNRSVRICMDLVDLLHDLQTERDESVKYVSKYASDVKARLVEAYTRSDRSIETVKEWPDEAGAFVEELGSRNLLQKFLNQHRYNIDLAQNSVLLEILFYERIIYAIHRWLISSLIEFRGGSMWKELVAYFEMQKAKEEFAVEKSLGSIFFYNNKFKKLEEYLKFSQSQEYGKLSMNLAKQYSQIYGTLVSKHGLNDSIQENLDDMRMYIRFNRTKIARSEKMIRVLQ